MYFGPGESGQPASSPALDLGLLLEGQADCLCCPCCKCGLEVDLVAYPMGYSEGCLPGFFKGFDSLRNRVGEIQHEGCLIRRCVGKEKKWTNARCIGGQMGDCECGSSVDQH